MMIHGNMIVMTRFTTGTLLAVALSAGAVTAHAAPLELSGSPGWTPDAGGHRDGFLPVAPGSPVNNAGTAVGFSNKYNANGGMCHRDQMQRM